MSSGQFIVPATVIRHIGAGIPQRQLDDIMQLKWEDTGRKNPFASVDALYTYILNRSPEPALAAKWIRVYTSARQQAPALYFKQLVEDVEGELHYVLGPLSSLVSIPAVGGRKDAPLQVYHKSLSDYLSSRSRCGEFHLGQSAMHAFLATRVVGVLKRKGPATNVPRGPDEWARFLDVFFDSTLLNLHSIEGRLPYSPLGRNKSPFGVLQRSFGGFLSSLDDHGRRELALCDVVWWTRLCLAQSPYKTEQFGAVFLSGMYAGIHHHICASGSDCHEACSHWRAGILTEAKALNWCVHELENGNLGELSEAKDDYFDARFKKLGESTRDGPMSCSICHPKLNALPE